MNRTEFQNTNTELLNNRMEIIEINESIRLLSKERDAWESAQMADICAAIDSDTQKPAYSNAEKRGAELAIRQTNSSEWKDIDEQLSALNMKAAGIRAQIDFLNNDIQYGINHAADEINDQMKMIATRVDAAINVAAHNAVKALMADIACATFDRAEKIEDDQKGK